MSKPGAVIVGTGFGVITHLRALRAAGFEALGLVGRDYVVSLIEGVGSNLVFAYGTGIGPNPTELTFEDLRAIAERKALEGA